jgi:hypothetical protein
VNNELEELRALRDFVLGYERAERIRDDYWDGPEEEFAISYIRDAIEMAKGKKS